MTKSLIAFIFLIFIFVACEEENNPESKPLIPSAVNYVAADEVIPEGKTSHEVVIFLSEKAEGPGGLEISVETVPGDYGVFFSTEPAAIDGKISLDVAEGATEVNFHILPVNNTKLNGNKTVSFLIANATGSVELGESIEYVLTVIDDELANKPQSWVKNFSSLSYTKNSFEYNEDGLVSSVHWESKNPFGTTTGTNQYTYNDLGKIILIARADGTTETKYTWTDGFIVKQEQISGGVLVSYNTYEYDEDSRVQKINTYTKNSLDEFVCNLYTVHTYHEDGNIHKIIIYSFSPASGEFVMSVTTTYEGYLEGHNPVQLEVLPGQSIQTKLPSYYSKETQTTFQEYNVVYEFSEEGNLVKKEVTGPVADSGITSYTYY